MNHGRAYRLTGAAIAATVFALYASTMVPSVAFWDNAVLATASAGPGVPDASVSVLFLLAARLLAPLHPSLDWAFSINLLNAVTAAMAVVAVYAAVVELLHGENERAFSRGATRAAALAGAAGAAAYFAMSDTFWNSAIAAGGSAPAMFLLALILIAALRWARTSAEPGASRLLLLLAFLLGLSTTVQRELAFVAAPVLLLVVLRIWQQSMRGVLIAIASAALVVFAAYPSVLGPIARLAVLLFGSGAGPLALGGTLILAALALLLAGTILAFMTGRSAPYFAALCAVLFLAGASPALVIPLRASQHPSFDLGHPATASRFADWLEQDKATAPAPGIAARMQYGVRDQFVRYFLWNTVGRAGDRIGAPPVWFAPASADHFAGSGSWTRHPFAFPMLLFGIPLVMGLAGLFRLYRHNPAAALFLFAVLLACGPLSAFIDPGALPLAREADARYAGTILVMALWIGIGIAWFVAALTRRSASASRAERGAALSMALVLPALFFGFQFLSAHPSHDRHADFSARDAACNMLQSCDSNAVLFTEGDNDTFPLLYAQDVLGVRPDVRVLNLGLLSEEWYCLHETAPRSDGRPRLPVAYTAAQIGAFARLDRDALLAVSSPDEWQDLSVPVDRRTMRRFLAESMEGLPRAVIDSLSRGRAVAALTYRVRAPHVIDRRFRGRYVPFLALAARSDDGRNHSRFRMAPSRVLLRVRAARIAAGSRRESAPRGSGDAADARAHVGRRRRARRRARRTSPPREGSAVARTPQGLSADRDARSVDLPRARGARLP
ncbi:MAG: DUF2723 domain-containing protein [Ignavibacteria bacterium]|nr:DUF2723 domain-containing protein [Ignavibacteria bacterium]